MMRYSVQPRDLDFYLMGKNIGKNISKNCKKQQKQLVVYWQ